MLRCENVKQKLKSTKKKKNALFVSVFKVWRTKPIYRRLCPLKRASTAVFRGDVALESLNNVFPDGWKLLVAWKPSIYCPHLLIRPHQATSPHRLDDAVCLCPHAMAGRERGDHAAADRDWKGPWWRKCGLYPSANPCREDLRIQHCYCLFSGWRCLRFR